MTSNPNWDAFFLGRFGREFQVAVAVKTAIKLGIFFSPQITEYIDVFICPGTTLAEMVADPKSIELILLPPCTNADKDSTATERIDGRKHFCRGDRVAVGDDKDTYPQSDISCLSCKKHER